jgi:LacI family transcriptional regulator
MVSGCNQKSERALRLVGVRFPQWWSFGMSMVVGVVDFMREHEMWRLATENDSFGEMEAVRLDADWPGDGLILFRAGEEELARHRQAGRAVVLISSEGPDLGFPRVIPDNRQIGRLAAEHLLECRFEEFAFLGRGETRYRDKKFAPGLRRYSRERFRGFRDRLGELHCEPTIHYLQGRPLWKKDTWKDVLREARDFLARLPVPCGLFVADDSLGAVVLRAADELGRRVPEELAVLGFGDDTAYCHSTFPPLSSIRFPRRKIGFEAARMLRRQMDGENVAGEVVRVPSGEVIPRESSDTLAIGDPEIRAMVSRIRCRAPYEALRVIELAKSSPLSMTTVKQRFAQWLGHGPKEEIKRVRLAHLRHLLCTTNLTLNEIARQMCFPSGHEASRFFFTETGERPSAYRAARATAPR